MRLRGVQAIEGQAFVRRCFGKARDRSGWRGVASVRSVVIDARSRFGFGLVSVSGGWSRFGFGLVSGREIGRGLASVVSAGSSFEGENAR